MLAPPNILHNTTKQSDVTAYNFLILFDTATFISWLCAAFSSWLRVLFYP